MSMFDPQAFMDTQTTETNATVYEPCPEGEWQATIADVQIKTGTSQKTGEDWARLDLKWEIVGTQANAMTERDKITVFHGIMLDITEGGAIATGKNRNVPYGLLREAVGLNVPGQPFSPRMLLGRSAKIAVKHREYQGKLQDDVKGVLPL